MKNTDLSFYDLVMSNGEPVDFYCDIVQTQDYVTGLVTETKTTIPIRRAVLTSFTSKYKFFASSDGQYERNDSMLFLMYADLPRNEFGKEDYFVVKGKKYLIVTHELVYDEGHIFVIRAVQNEKPLQVKTINIRHAIQMGITNDQS